MVTNIKGFSAGIIVLRPWSSNYWCDQSLMLALNINVGLVMPTLGGREQLWVGGSVGKVLLSYEKVCCEGGAQGTLVTLETAVWLKC